MPDLRDRVLRLRQRAGDLPDLSAVLAELEAACEELRVAADEIREQEQEIRRLRETHRLMRWQHERMQHLLPAAVVTTDAAGTIESANAAAVALVGTQMGRLVHTDLFGLVAPEERSDLRAAAAELTSQTRLRRAVTLLGPHGRAIPVEVSAASATMDGGGISWVFVVLPPSEAGLGDQVAVSEALVDLTGLLASPLEDLELLRRASMVCRRALGPGSEVSISVGAPIAPTRVASTAPVAQMIDGAQLVQEAGPSVLAFEGGETVVARDLRDDDRWQFLADDPRIPTASAVAVPLTIGGERLGVLSVYADAGLPTIRFVRSVEMLSAAVAAVLHEAVVHGELERESAELEEALRSRATIDQAKGIVMAERACGPQEAFDHLVELSSTQHVKLRDLARMLVEQRSTGGAGTG